MADWEGTRKIFTGSANHMSNMEEHGEALIEYVEDDEDDAFDMLLDIQDHDDNIKRDL